MKGMTLEAVAKACDGIYHGSDGDKIKEVSAITTDSRQIQPQGMFIAIKGARSDGHAYIDSFMKKERSAVFPSRSFRERKDRTFR